MSTWLTLFLRIIPSNWLVILLFVLGCLCIFLLILATAMRSVKRSQDQISDDNVLPSHVLAPEHHSNRPSYQDEDRSPISREAPQDHREDHWDQVSQQERGADIDTLTFILTVAAGVLSAVIARLIGDSFESVSPNEVNQIVSVNVRRGANSQISIHESDIEGLTHSAILEVYEIAKRDEIFDIESGRIRLRPGVPTTRDMIDYQIKHLDMIVELRKRELLNGLSENYSPEEPNNSLGSKGDEISRGDGSYKWIEAEPQLPESRGHVAIREMHERIRNRKLGGGRN